MADQKRCVCGHTIASEPDTAYNYGMKIDFPDLCIFRMVYGDEINDWSDRGWRVVAAYPAQRMHRSRLVRVPAFLLARSRDDTLETLRQQLGRANTQHHEAQRRAREADIAHKAVTEKLDAMTKERDALAGESESRRLRLVRGDETKSKLERDLAKIREAIGTKAFNEITGGSK